MQASWLNKAGVEVMDNAMFRPLRAGEELPLGRADLYFGPDPRVAAEMPQMKAQIKIAGDMLSVAQLAKPLGYVLILLGGGSLGLEMIRRRLNTASAARQQPPQKPDCPKEASCDSQHP